MTTFRISEQQKGMKRRKKQGEEEKKFVVARAEVQGRRVPLLGP